MRLPMLLSSFVIGLAHLVVSHASKAKNVLPCSWSAGQEASLWIYVNDEPIQMKFDDRPIAKIEPITFGSFDRTVQFDQTLPFDLSLPLNKDSSQGRKKPFAKIKGPIFAHIYLTKKGIHPDPGKIGQTSAQQYHQSVVYRRLTLLDGMPPPPSTSHLLDKGKHSTVEEEEEKYIPFPSEHGENDGFEEQIAYWYPEINLALVQSTEPVDLRQLGPGVARSMMLSIDGQAYLPTIYTYEGWRLKSRRILLHPNDFIQTSDATMQKSLPLKIYFSPIGLTKLYWLAHFDESFRISNINSKIASETGTRSFLTDEKEVEKLKQMFFDTNPYLLGITLIVSILHSILDFLAFKNDVQFWKNRKNLQGLSVRSVLINAVFQLVILLYLLDEDTSVLILASVAIGTLIELWKITKVVDVTVGRWYIRITDRATYAATPTQEYDNKAVRWLAIICIPALLGYAGWSLIYQRHRSWYSWILNTLVGFVYTFGFITMTPQLFINYKLKSVAHMPWRVFIYKALNTFIDDLFAFIIKMPMLHRIACFRDDVVFLVYLYQLWIYPVDKSRPNEYGQVFVEGKVDEHQESGEEESETITFRTKEKTESSDNNRPTRRAGLRVRHAQKS